MNSFIRDNDQWVNYGAEHCWSSVAAILIGILIYLYLKRLSRSEQERGMIILAILTASVQLAKPILKWNLGIFDSYEDIPLHLCNMLPFFLIVIFTLRSRWMWGMVFMWIMAGCIQSLFTPTLEHSIPHYEYWRYWIVHSGLVYMAILPIALWGYQLYFRDVIIGWIGINVTAFTVMGINALLNTNYMYMQAKPPGTTLYTALGEWPWYILHLQLIAFFLFLSLWLIYRLTAGLKAKTQAVSDIQRA